MGKFIGNTPKVMPLDTCLFQDIKESVQKHVRNPAINNDCLFLMTTPKNAWRAYSQIFDPKQVLHPPLIKSCMISTK